MTSKNKNAVSGGKINLFPLIIRCLIVFLIPTITMLIIYKKMDMHPFGDKCILSIDLWGQYFPIYQQFGRNFSLSDAMYEWTGGLGYNNFVQTAYYCRSLLLLPLKLLPFEAAIPYLNFACLLKFGLSAVTCQLFLEYKFRNKTPMMMSLSVCYAMCAYATAFIMQFMWTDTIFLAPLMLIGLERLMKGKSPLLYVLMLALIVYSNFYLGFGTCLFTALYFVSEMIKRIEPDPTKKHLKWFGNRSEIGLTTFRFGLYSMIAGVLNAVIILPTLKGLSHSLPANEGTLDFSKWYHTFAENIASLLPMTEISLEFGVANICTGLIMFLLVPLYFMNRQIKYREKIASGGLLLILYSALNYNPLDYFFNGLHFPNQLPGRWSFLFSLAIVIVAASGLSRFKKADLPAVFSAWLVGVFFVYFSKNADIPFEKGDKVFKWAIFLAANALLLALYMLLTEAADRRDAKDAAEAAAADMAEKAPESEAAPAAPKKKAFPIQAFRRGLAFLYALAFAGLTCYEVCSNSVVVATGLSKQMPSSSKTSYDLVSATIREFGEKYDCPKDEFYRCETNMGWTFDDGLLGGYNAITYYASTLNGDAFQLLRYLGNGMYAKNVSIIYNMTSPVQNSIFGVRYFLDRARNLDTLLPNLKLVEETNDYKVWENPTALPIAFGVSNNINDLTLGESLKPVSIHNDLINMMYGEEINVFDRFDAESVLIHNANLGENDDWNQNYFYRQDDSEPVTLTYTYRCPSDQPIFMEQNFRAGSINMFVGDNCTEIKPNDKRFMYVGTYPAGTEIRFEVSIDNVNIGCCGINMFTLDSGRWQAAYELFKAGSLNITSFKNTRIDGKLNMLRDGTVFTSIPQDDGWKVYVDGKKVETTKIGDALVGFPLALGAHEISLRYSCPGFKLGLMVTILTAGALVLCLRYRKNPKKQKPAPEVKPAEENDNSADTAEESSEAAAEDENESSEDESSEAGNTEK